MKTTFPKERMLSVLYNDGEGKVISDEIYDTSRWSNHYKLIFELDGKTWQTTYSRGATESQDEYPWDYEDDVGCTEVIPVEKTVIVWVPAE